MARAVVTGGWGFIGSHLTEALLKRGDEVTVVDAAPAPPHLKWLGEQAGFVKADVRDAEALATAITLGVDIVYHLASVVGVDQYLSRPLDVIDVNFGGTRNVLDLVARTGAQVVVASTSEVFGKNPAVPWAEDGDRVLGPTSSNRWVYSSSKALAEHLTFAFAAQHDVRATVVRYFNAYGPRQRPAYIVSRTVHRAVNGIAPVLYDGGGQTRCFTYIDDAVAGTIAAAASGGGLFNLGSSEETTVGEVIGLIAELIGHTPPALLVDTERSLGRAYEDLPRRVPDTTKARSTLGWEASIPLHEGLARTIDWARSNRWWLSLPDSGAEPVEEIEPTTM